jgi:hypothetical protein
VDAAAMASLQTLGEIVTHMQEEAGNFPLAEAASSTLGSAVSAAVSSSSFPSGLSRYRVQPCVAPASSLIEVGLWDGPLFVLHADQPLADLLTQNLCQAGVDVYFVTHLPDSVSFVVDIRALRQFQDVDDACDCSLQSFLAAKHISSDPKVFVVAQDLGGLFGFESCEPLRAWSGGVAGVVRTAAREWPEALCKVIDLATSGRSLEKQASLLAQEILSGGPEVEVGIPLTGERSTLWPEASQPQPLPMALGSNDVIIVSGGARGVTASSVVALAQSAPAKFALFGRTPLAPDPAPQAENKPALIRALRGSDPSLSPKELNRMIRNIEAGREIRQIFV